MKCACDRKPMRWYVMTSATTDADTKQHFEQHNFFGLQRDQVVFFQQVGVQCWSTVACTRG